MEIPVLFVILTYLGAISLPTTLSAQAPYHADDSALVNTRTDTQTDNLTISKRVDEVNLTFTVMDKKDRFISNLGASDFQILDNHLPPQVLKYFQQQSDLPLRVALLIDASDSVRYRFKFEQKAAGVFLKKILRPMKDQAFVVAFDSRVHLFHDLSDNVPALCKSVNSIQAGGETALYDALIFSSNKLRTIPESQVTRRAVILISDGVDTASRALMHDAEEAAARAETTIFALSTNDPVFDRQGEMVLDALTSPTGGGILAARDESQLTDAFGHIEKALRNQYALAYQPAAFNLDGGYRRVEIVPRRRGFRVQCRKGYFAKQGEGAAPNEARATN